MVDKNPTEVNKTCKIVKARFLALGSEEDGVALVMTLAIFFFMYLGCMGIFSIGMAVRDRIHLQNAVDAAAYSAAVVQADTISRVASVNRAMAWSYVQMTRHQMDYIVYKWLDCTYAHYKNDQKTAKANHGFSGYCKGAMHLTLSMEALKRHRHYKRDEQWMIKASDNPLAGRNTVQLNGTWMNALPAVGGLSNLGTISDIETVGTALTIGGVSTTLGVTQSGDPVALTAALTGNSILVSVPAVRTAYQSVRSLASGSYAANPLTYIQTLQSAGDSFRSIKEIMSEATKGDRSYSDPKYKTGIKRFLNILKAQILCDKLNIAAMNIYSRKMVLEMPRKIDQCVADVVKANLPYSLHNSCRYFLQQNLNPLAFERFGSESGLDTFFVGGYFCNLHNNATDERRFIRFADYEESLVKTFRKVNTFDSLFSRTAAGLDQWFVRGDGKQRTDDEVGFQRSYKHWAEGPHASSHMAYNPYLPSCWNTVNLHASPQTVALHSQWQWYARNWYCAYVPPTPWTGEFDIHVPIPLWTTCGFHSRPGLDTLAYVMAIADWARGIPDMVDYVKDALQGVQEDEDGNPINPNISVSGGYETPLPSTNGGTTRSPADNYEYGCLTTMDGFVMNKIDGVPVPVPLFTSYARLYADDKHLYNTCYVGEKAMPLVIRKNYFGKDGTIVVGIARKNENAFVRILRTIEGIFAAFDPAVGWSWAFSAAKAGYKDKGADAEKRDYRIDWQDDNQDWNLCQSDWDAVFVPVRQAETRAEKLLGISTWTIGSKSMVDNWVSHTWRSVGSSAPHLENSMESPPGMQVSSRLNWRSVTDVMYH